MGVLTCVRQASFTWEIETRDGNVNAALELGCFDNNAVIKLSDATYGPRNIVNK